MLSPFSVSGKTSLSARVRRQIPEVALSVANKIPLTRSAKWPVILLPIDNVEANSLLSMAKKGGQMQAYCMKCRAKREVRDPRRITMKNGRPATQGLCPVCGTKVFRIGK
jgi:hypothetical protein